MNRLVLSNQLPFGTKKERKKEKIGGLLEGKSETAKIATREIEEFEKTPTAVPLKKENHREKKKSE